MRKVLLADIIIDPQVQIRDSLKPNKVQEYAQILDQLPPIDLFEEEETRFYLGDGFHRVEAAKLTGRESVTAKVSPGGREAALEHAALANAKHGIPLTRAEKAKAVKRLLKIHPEWSDRRIAEGLGVDHRTVGRYREKMAGGEIPHLDIRQGADGKTYPAQVERQVEPETRQVAVREHVREIPVRQNGNHVATIAVPEEAEPDDIEEPELNGYVYRVNGQVQAGHKNGEQCHDERSPLLLAIEQLAAHLDRAQVAGEASAIFKERNVAEGKEYLNPKDGGDVYGPDDVANLLEAMRIIAEKLGQQQKREQKEQPASPIEQFYSALRVLTPDRIAPTHEDGYVQVRPNGSWWPEPFSNFCLACKHTGLEFAYASNGQGKRGVVYTRCLGCGDIQRGALWLKPDEKAVASQE